MKEISTPKDYFIKRIVTEQNEDKKARENIVFNAILGLSGIISAVYTLGTEEYAFNNVAMEYICPMAGLVGATLCYYDAKDSISKLQRKQRESQTPAEKAKVYTKNIQRQITFK